MSAPRARIRLPGSAQARAERAPNVSGGCEDRVLSVEMRLSAVGSASFFLPVPRLVGAVAQLGERLHGMQEVTSSILVSSTPLFVSAEREDVGQRRDAFATALRRVDDAS